MTKHNLQILRNLAIVFAIFFSSITFSYSQSWFSEVTQSGFILKKVVSDTTIATGQSFSYTIYYTIPAGATNVTITDVLPPGLIYLGSSTNNACGTPTITAPAINSLGGTFSLNWASIPGGCSSSLTITVAFPNGETCPGVTARNNACLSATLAGKQYDLCTGFLLTTAIAVNPWHINKYPLGLAWIGGNCPWATGGDTVTYQICVYKDVGTTGQLNLVSGIVTDTLPTGAVLVSSTCGATQSGNLITWNVGNMSALPAYNSACCQFRIYYPLAQFPSGSFISNIVSLSGGLGPTAPQPCSSFSTTASTCIKKEIITSLTLSKWVYTNRQPGCAGQYLIYICNNGTTSMPVTVLDTLPTQLSGYSVGSIWPVTFTASITSGILSINGNLSPGQCAYVYVNFTIPTNAVVGSTITNCAYLTSVIPNQSYCTSFVIDPPAAKPCLWKEVCNKQTSYIPGSIFRYRLRIQNIGGLPLTGVILNDVLSPNLQYVGNPSYYTLNTWSVPNCNPTPNPGDIWAGVTLGYNTGTNTVTATLPAIPAACQNIFYNACGMYGTPGVPYYYIEFDVKVRDTSALGNVPNTFALSGGVLGTTTVTSNVEYVLVVGVVGYNLNKDIRKPSDTTFTSGMIVVPGSNVVYRLKMNSSGTAALTHISFVDLLPLDAPPTNDQKILAGCGTRGSQFNITYNSAVGTPIPAVPTGYSNSIVALANVNNFTPVGAPGTAFTIGCGIVGTWISGVASGDKNIGEYFGPIAVGLTGAEFQFLATISPSALPKQISCNTFAASGWTKHLIQSSILSYQRAGELESGPVCVTIDSVKKCIENGKIDVKCLEKDPKTGFQQYSIAFSASSCFPGNITFSSPDGTFSPSSFTISSSPWSFNPTFTHTNANNPIKIIFTIVCGNEVCKDSIMRDLPNCPIVTPPGCCDQFIKIIKDPKIIWNSATGFVGISVPMVAGPTPIKRFSATIVSAQLRKVCLNTVYPWARIFGDITNANLVIQPNPGPQFLNIFSREAVWGEADTCVNWMNSANLNLKMLFPPFSGTFKCKDTLRFGIRYSFTDCKCLTCDTVVFYTIVRRIAFIPWDPRGNGTIGLPPMIEKGEGSSGSVIQAAPPTQTSLEMSSMTAGTFWIISPSNPDNTVIVKGMEFYCPDLEFASIKYSNVTGTVNGNSAKIDVEASPGSTREISLTFKNTSLSKFTVYATFRYILVGETEELFSDPIPYYVVVPGLAGDEMGVDKGTKPTGVKTYAIYMHNKNGYDENVSAITLKPNTNHTILAAGPPQDGENGITLFPRLQADGTYFIAMPATGDLALPSTVVKPIFLTFAGDNTTEPELTFATYNEFGAKLGEGTFKLSDPISKVNESGNSGMIDMLVYPNPASHSASVSFTLPFILDNAVISVFDILGRPVANVMQNGNLDSGTHIFNFDTSNLSTGTYYIEIRSNKLTESINFTISK